MDKSEFTNEELDRPPGVLSLATWDDAKYARFLAARKVKQDSFYQALFGPFDKLFPLPDTDGEAVFRSGLESLRRAIEKNCSSLGQQAMIAGAALEIAMGLVVSAKVSSDIVEASRKRARAAMARAAKKPTGRDLDDIIVALAYPIAMRSQHTTPHRIAEEIREAVAEEMRQRGLRLRRPGGVAGDSMISVDTIRKRIARHLPAWRQH